MNDYRPFGDFMSVAEIIEEQVKPLKNCWVIKGFDFVPHTENLYADLRLHPNDKGFDHYFQNLSKQIRAVLYQQECP